MVDSKTNKVLQTISPGKGKKIRRGVRWMKEILNAIAEKGAGGQWMDREWPLGNGKMSETLINRQRLYMRSFLSNSCNSIINDCEI
jgi:hypothetical protein